MTKKMTKSLLVELDAPLHKALKQLAATEDASMADIVRICIKTRIDNSHKKVVY